MLIPQNLKFLMVCRKHSLGYIELVRGNYIFETYKDIGYIKKIFGLMTSREIENIKKKDFDMLWNDLWVLDNLHESHQKEYEQAKNKFQLLIKGINIKLYIGNISEDKYINLKVDNFKKTIEELESVLDSIGSISDINYMNLLTLYCLSS